MAASAQAPAPTSVQMWMASDGTMYQQKADAAVHNLQKGLAAVYLKHRPGQIGHAELFASAMIDASVDLIPLLEQVAEAKALK